MGSVPFRSMLSLVATQFALNPTLQLLDPSLADFGPAVKEFVEAFVAYGDKLDQGIKYSWMGAIASQYPDIRNWSASRTQNETALMASSRTIPCLVLQGAMDKLLDGEKVRDLMNTFSGTSCSGCGRTPVMPRSLTIPKGPTLRSSPLRRGSVV